MRILPVRAGGAEISDTLATAAPNWPTATYSAHTGQPVKVSGAWTNPDHDRIYFSGAPAIGGGYSYYIQTLWAAFDVETEQPDGLLASALLRLVFWTGYHANAGPMMARVRVAAADATSWDEGQDLTETFAALDFLEEYVAGELADSYYEIATEFQIAPLILSLVKSQQWASGRQVLVLIEPVLPDLDPADYMEQDRKLYQWAFSPDLAEERGFDWSDWNGWETGDPWGTWLLVDMETATPVIVSEPANYTVEVDGDLIPALNVQLRMSGVQPSAATISSPIIASFAPGAPVTITGIMAAGDEKIIFTGVVTSCPTIRGGRRQSTTINAVSESLPVSQQPPATIYALQTTGHGLQANQKRTYQGAMIPGIAPNDLLFATNRFFVADSIAITLSPRRSSMSVTAK